MMSAYNAFGEKKMYGKTVQGVIRSTVWIDSNGNVKKHWKRVSNAGEHPAKVLETLKQA